MSNVKEVRKTGKKESYEAADLLREDFALEMD